MDVSVLDELPPGRQPIDTVVLPDTRRDEVINRVRGLLDTGQQVYWVCPLIEDSDLLPATSIERTSELLRRALPHAAIAELHGRMPSQQKASVMAAFKNAEYRLLVATTVVEVGVDVANATLMVIENPERLGLAQLHQLRGRVGRGSVKSHCVLLYTNPLSAAGRARLKVIRDSQDGFYIAEQDLKLRGPGDLLGARQTGEQQFRVADLAEHAHLIPEIVAHGDKLLAQEPATVQRLLALWAPRESGHITV
jgi:ATP-dependent DNA helicase RecG